MHCEHTWICSDYYEGPVRAARCEGPVGITLYFFNIYFNNKTQKTPTTIITKNKQNNNHNNNKNNLRSGGYSGAVVRQFIMSNSHPVYMPAGRVLCQGIHVTNFK